MKSKIIIRIETKLSNSKKKIELLEERLHNAIHETIEESITESDEFEDYVLRKLDDILPKKINEFSDLGELKITIDKEEWY